MSRWIALTALTFSLSTSAACSTATDPGGVRSASGVDIETREPARTSLPTAAARPTAAPCEAGRFIAALPRTLPHLHTEADLEALRTPLASCAGVARTSFVPGSRPTLLIELSAPLDAMTTARALGVAGPHMITTTVHQESFHLARSSFDDAIVFGAWNVTAIGQRPSGPLPNERFGPAPAYDLAQYQGRITHVAIAARSPQ